MRRLMRHHQRSAFVEFREGEMRGGHRLPLLVVAALLVACATRRVPSELARVTASEWASALADSVHGWCHARSDGTARGDSARRLYSAACWSAEGAEPALARRYLDAALALGGVPADPATARDLDVLLALLRYNDSFRLAQLDAATRRWPTARPLWEQQAQLLSQLGRSSEAAVARARASALPKEQRPDGPTLMQR